MQSHFGTAQQGESVESLRKLDYAPRQIFGNSQPNYVHLRRDRVQNLGDLSKVHTSSGHTLERVRGGGWVAENQKVVMGWLEHIDVEMNRHPLGTCAAQPGEDRFRRCRQFLRVEMGEPMFRDEGRLERGCFSQPDIQNAAWV